MIKLYLLYLIFGFYIFFESLLIWQLSIFFYTGVITYVALVGSVALFTIAAPLSLYRIRMASAIGLICLLGIFPFGIHWLLYRIINEAPIILGTYNQIILLATVLFIIALFYTVKYLVQYNKLLSITPLKKWIKLFMVFIPIALLLLMIGLVIINP